jgi:hypothetical protein
VILGGLSALCALRVHETKPRHANLCIKGHVAGGVTLTLALVVAIFAYGMLDRLLAP